MYKREDIQSLADLHYKTWPAWHKTPEGAPAHRWFTTEFEKIMRSIDHGTTLPYWDPYLYGTQPERSSIWETLGHSGDYSDAYEVPDGLYPRLNLATSIKRHWPNGTIPPWVEWPNGTIPHQNTKLMPYRPRNHTRIILEILEQ